jgi:RNA polymerase sigma-70 factor (ECF subfamily)
MERPRPDPEALLAHEAFLRRIARPLVRDDASVDDVVQETWLRSISRLATFRFESSLATWLAAIVLNVAREMSRPRAQVVPFDSLGELPDRADADPAVIAEHDLAPLLGRLPDGYRAVLVLHDFEGFTHTEIAAALGIAPSTAKSQLARARAAARALIELPLAGGERRPS